MNKYVLHHHKVDVRRVYIIMTDVCTVKYEVYPPAGVNVQVDGVIDWLIVYLVPLSAPHRTISPTPSIDFIDTSSLDAFLAQCMTILQPLTANYIWQRDALQLVPSLMHAPPWQAPSTNSTPPNLTPPCLWGSSCVGESVEDEWFITSLMKALTAALPCTARCAVEWVRPIVYGRHAAVHADHKYLLISQTPAASNTHRVWDDDGEFVLIEAAYSLPKWLNPDTATHRVWWHGGRLHIVPRPSAQHPTLPPTPTAQQALTIVRGDVIPSAASARVMATLDRRMSGVLFVMGGDSGVVVGAGVCSMGVNRRCIECTLCSLSHAHTHAIPICAHTCALHPPTQGSPMMLTPCSITLPMFSSPPALLLS